MVYKILHMESISLSKVADIQFTDESISAMEVILAGGSSFPISFYFIHANELKFCR